MAGGMIGIYIGIGKSIFFQKEISKMILYFAMAFFLFSFPRLSSGEERKFISYVGMEIRDDVKILFIDENS